MSLDTKKIPAHIMEDLASRGYSEEEVSRLDAAKAFDEYLRWNGIHGYGSMLRSAVHALDKAERSK